MILKRTPAPPLQKHVAEQDEQRNTSNNACADPSEFDEIVAEVVDKGSVHVIAKSEGSSFWESKGGGVERDGGKGRVDISLDDIKGLLDAAFHEKSVHISLLNGVKEALTLYRVCHAVDRE